MDNQETNPDISAFLTSATHDMKNSANVPPRFREDNPALLDAFARKQALLKHMGIDLIQDHSDELVWHFDRKLVASVALDAEQRREFHLGHQGHQGQTAADFEKSVRKTGEPGSLVEGNGNGYGAGITKTQRG
jgi:hypothetical protein